MSRDITSASGESGLANASGNAEADKNNADPNLMTIRNCMRMTRLFMMAILAASSAALLESSLQAIQFVTQSAIFILERILVDIAVL